MKYGIGVDVGTTNLKVVAAGADGRICGAAARPLASVRNGEVATQDAEQLWRSVAGALGEVAAAVTDAGGEVGGVCICSQYSSIVPVDSRAEPLTDLVLWWDRRGTDRSWQIMERHPEAFETFVEHHGIPPVGSGLSLAHILHLQHDRPDVHSRCAAYLEPMDYVAARLTGVVAATQCTMFMSQLCDNRTVGTTGYDPKLVALSGVDEAKLPPLVPIDGTVGEVTDGAAAQTGLPAGVPVHAGMNDSQAGALASGAFTDGRAGLAIGTTAVLVDEVGEMRVDLERELVSMPAPVPGRWLAWAENGIAGGAIAHVLENVIFASDELADHSIDDHFERLDPTLESTPPGSGGVMFLPWLSGSLAPAADGNVRGAFLNLSLETRRTDLVRAMVEGTAHNLRWLLPVVEGFTSAAIREIVFYGGAARSQGWAQALADILERPVTTLARPELAVARAMALVALERSGELGEGSLDAMLEVRSTFEPREPNLERYRKMHEQFVAAFEALRPIYGALNG